MVNFAISFAVVTGLFALLFKVVPDAKIAWRDVWMGAAFTALLFTIGKLALGLYLGRASVASPYGAAGSVIVLVIWVTTRRRSCSWARSSHRFMRAGTERRSSRATTQ